MSDILLEKVISKLDKMKQWKKEWKQKSSKIRQGPDIKQDDINRALEGSPTATKQRSPSMSWEIGN